MEFIGKDGKKYWTVEKTVTYSELHCLSKNGNDMFCVAKELPIFPSLTEVCDYMVRNGAEIVQPPYGDTSVKVVPNDQP